MKTMISEKQLDDAAALQAGLSDEEWVRRGDVLFERQKTLFLEVLTFARDEPASNLGKVCIDFLSSLQFVGDAVTKGNFPTFEHGELAAAVEEGTQTISRQLGLPPAAWTGLDSMRDQPFVWARLFAILQKPDVQNSSLFNGVAVTLWAVTKLYADRLSGMLDARDGAKRN